MDFINRMKKREYIELSLKTVIAMCACFIAVILMCGMIYGIGIKSYMKYGKSKHVNSSSTIAYCIKVDDDQYFVMYYNPTDDKDSSQLTATALSDMTVKTKAECEAMASTEETRGEVKEVRFCAPSASIVLREFVKGWHIAIVAVVIAGIMGYFVYRYIKLGKDYKKVITTFNETGTIEF